MSNLLIFYSHILAPVVSSRLFSVSILNSTRADRESQEMMFKILLLCGFVATSVAQRGSYASGHRPVSAPAQSSVPTQTQSNFAAPTQAAPSRVDVVPANNYLEQQQSPEFGGSFGPPHQGFQTQSFGGGLGHNHQAFPSGFYPGHNYPFGFNGR